jgi:hypothetical protein
VTVWREKIERSFYFADFQTAVEGSGEIFLDRRRFVPVGPPRRHEETQALVAAGVARKPLLLSPPRRLITLLSRSF